MDSLRVIDNVFEESVFAPMRDLAMGDLLPWYFNDNVVENASGLQNYQFTHTLFRSGNWYSNYLETFSPVFDFLGAKELLKVKINSTMWSDSIVEHGLHIDVWNEKSKTAILYFNSNDGYTRFENGPKIETVENRLIVFNSMTNHTGTNCTNAKRRVVLNVNFLS